MTSASETIGKGIIKIDGKRKCMETEVGHQKSRVIATDFPDSFCPERANFVLNITLAL